MNDLAERFKSIWPFNQAEQKATEPKFSDISKAKNSTQDQSSPINPTSRRQSSYKL